MKILFIAPHLSTGGMPSFLLKRIESLLKYTDAEIKVIEFKNYSDEYVVQKNKIKELVDVVTFGYDKTDFISTIKEYNPDIIHIDEIPEGFDSYNKFPDEILSELYSKDRTWRVVETCHNVWFNPDEMKRFHPDAYALCTPYHMETFKNMPSLKKVIEFPIENLIPTADERLSARIELGFTNDKSHVVNIGLWTPGKNQAEVIELARVTPNIDFHFVGNQAPNFEFYWKPLMDNLPSNCKVWGERDDVSKFLKACDVFMFNSTWECNPLVVREAISNGCTILARDLPQYCGMFDTYITPINPDNLKYQLYYLLENPSRYTIPDGEDKKFALSHIDLYTSTKQQPVQENIIKVNIHFVKQPLLEILGESNELFTVEWYDEKGLVYRSQIGCNQWTKLNREYYTNWRVIVLNSNAQVIYDYTYNDESKRVYIAMDSRSLGDTLAWIPYCEEYRKQHNCDLVVSTFWNKLFVDAYPEIEFVEPGSTVKNLYAMYTIGWFYDENKEPELPNTIPLQKTASNILGIEYKEIKPIVGFDLHQPQYKKYVTIATNSTAGCKFWTRENWQQVINYLSDNGYKVVNVSLEDNKFKNCVTPKDKSIENTMNLIHHSDFFIGLSSGLSWLAWALNKEVIMISNFTEADHEFTCHRPINKDVCNGCWNKPYLKFDKGDWNWCPVHKGTERQFECQTSITPQMVMDEIKKAGY